ncbi:MAG: hypothetical protein HY926_00700 [Elusimicrobia bacterium]|nr:hypothetical protein [Elusimicrobiota bacterium]
MSLFAAGLILSARLLAADAVRVQSELRETALAPAVLPGQSLGSAATLSGGLAAPALGAAVISLPAPQVKPAEKAAVAAALQKNAVQIQTILADPAAGPAGEEKASGISAKVFDNVKPAPAAEAGPAVLAEPGEKVPIAQLVKAAADRRFGGVSIHQEQEGNLSARDPRDSSGSVFDYYRPVEMRPALVAEVRAGMHWTEKVGYQFHRLTRFYRAKSPFNDWDDFPLESKLKYVSLLDAAETRERGRDSVWDGPLFKLLERSPRAPPYVSRHPHLEEPRLFRGQNPFARYMEPEIVTDREHPAATAREAIGRTKAIIADTGHAGTHYHVFLRVEPEVLRQQLPALQSMLQLLNNVLFAQAAAKSYDNLFHPFLLPWHEGRSGRVARLVSEASPEPSRPDHRDPDNEKFAFVAFRYWGLEDGRLVVSFELRGANIPWKHHRRAGGGQFDTDVPKPERDYSEVERYLTFLVLYADRLARGTAPALSEPSLRLDLAAADQALAERARKKGLQPEDYLDLTAFSKMLFADSANQPQVREDRARMVHPSLLLPFAAADAFGPATRAHLERLADTYLEQSARLKAFSRDGRPVDDALLRNVKYLFWEDYGAWARSLLGKDEARFEELFRSLAR